MGELKTTFYKEDKKKTYEQIRELIKQSVPCEPDYLIAKIELETGLSRVKAQEALGTFFNAKMIAVKNKLVVIHK